MVTKRQCDGCQKEMSEMEYMDAIVLRFKEDYTWHVFHNRKCLYKFLKQTPIIINLTTWQTIIVMTVTAIIIKMIG